jgi:hypothetical protein
MNGAGLAQEPASEELEDAIDVDKRAPEAMGDAAACAMLDYMAGEEGMCFGSANRIGNEKRDRVG